MTAVPHLDDHGFVVRYNNVRYILQFVIAVCIILWLFSKPKLNLPNGPVGIPFLGYLPFLGNEPHKTLDKLKKKYGSVFSLRLGLDNVIVLADYQAVEDALSKSASIDRPHGIFDFLPGGLGIVAANGELWVEERRFAIRTMRNLGLGKTIWISLVEEELTHFLKLILRSKGEPVDIFKLLSPSTSNVMLSLIFGKRFPTKPVLESLNIESQLVMRFFSPSSVWNYLPWICNVLRKTNLSYYNEAHSKMQHFHNFFRNEVQNCKKEINNEKKTDFVAEYLQFLHESKRVGKETLLNERTMIGDAQNLFLGGSDTTRTSIIWLFLIVAAYPQVQDKIYAELEPALGLQEIPLWEDRVKFPYTNAVILEAQRWRTIVPLNTPRTASEDMKILGYDIPKGSVIIANIWGLHNDARYWEKPEAFIPERFLENEGKQVNLKRKSFVPFSMGKRKCPGETVAMMQIFLYFTTVMRNYEIQVPNGGKPTLEDGIMGLIYMPLPQNLCFVCRHKT